MEKNSYWIWKFDDNSTEKTTIVAITSTIVKMFRGNYIFKRYRYFSLKGSPFFTDKLSFVFHKWILDQLNFSYPNLYQSRKSRIPTPKKIMYPSNILYPLNANIFELAF